HLDAQSAQDRGQLAASEAPEENPAVLGGGDAQARSSILVGWAACRPPRARLRHALETVEDLRGRHRTVPGSRPRSSAEPGTVPAPETPVISGPWVKLSPLYPVSPVSPG